MLRKKDQIFHSLLLWIKTEVMDRLEEVSWFATVTLHSIFSHNIMTTVKETTVLLSSFVFVC